MIKVKPRLLIILNRFVIGGQSVDTIPLAWYLQQHFEVRILYGQKEADELEPDFLLQQYPNLSLTKVSSLRRSVNPLVDVVGFLKILAFVWQFKPQIVHTHGAKSGVFGRIAAYILRTPVIVHTFHGHLFHSYFNNTLSSLIKFAERSLAKITDGFIVLSTSQLTDLVQVFKILPLNKCRIIPLGFDLQLIENTPDLRSAFRQTYGLKNTDVAIGIVCRIVPIKNHAFFVKVIKAILTKNNNSNAAFFIVGDGELKQKVQQQLQAEGIAFSSTAISQNVRVVFTSWLKDIPEVMSGLDIIALTSNNEGTPLSAIEAQAFQKPVISTNVGGVADTMLAGISGFLIPNGDLDGYIQQLQLLINNSNLRQNMGKAARAFIEEKFSKQKEVQWTKDFYISLL